MILMEMHAERTTIEYSDLVDLIDNPLPPQEGD